jgi:peroxiredoxin Q/BCP
VTTRLQAGDIAPEFTLSDDTDQSVSLADFRGQRVIVYFYPAAITPGCTTQACDFSDSLDALGRAGVCRARHLSGHPGQAREASAPRTG